MKTVKILDTCTLINIFDGPDPDLKDALAGYDVVITDSVVTEYVCKIPRKIPEMVSVAGLDESEHRLMDDLEYLFPGLALGERSVMSKALSLVEKGYRVIALTDDKKALKKLSNYSQDEILARDFPHCGEIVWCDKGALRDHHQRSINQSKIDL